MKNVYELNPELKAYEIDECSNFAQEKLIAYAEEQACDVEITVENGEVYLRGESSEFFEDNAQVLFDEYFAEKAEEFNR